LKLSDDSEIRIYTSPLVLPRPIVAISPQAEPVPEATSLPVQDATDPEIITRLRALETWVVLHSPDPEVMNRLMALEAREQPHVPQSNDPQIIERLAALETMVTQYRPDPEITARLAALEARPEAQEMAGIREIVNIQPVAPVVLHVHPHPQVTQHVPHFVVTPRVIPGLPDPNNGRTYRLQVGAFSARQSADRVSQLVSSLGFTVAQEWTGTMHRVLATDVPAALVSSAVQRLGLIGIEQVWVRE
jgi:cell division protein FtsN